MLAKRELRFPQKATQKAKSWPIPNNLMTTEQIYADLLNEVPELEEQANNKQIKILIYSLAFLTTCADNFLFKEMQAYNKQKISVIIVIDIFWYYQREITLNVIRHRLGVTDHMIKIGARQVEIRPVSAAVAREFSNKYSAHGFRASTIKLGAYFQDELVSLMTFGAPFLSFNAHKVDYECHRHCGLPNIQVTGLINKMLKYLYDNYNALTVLNYKENLHFNDWDAPNKPGYVGEIGVTTYYIIDNVLYPRMQVMNMRDRLSMPMHRYPKLGTPGSAIYVMSTLRMEEMF